MFARPLSLQRSHLVILLIVCFTFLFMLVGEFSFWSANNLQIDIFLHFHHLSAWNGISNVRRNSVGHSWDLEDLHGVAIREKRAKHGIQRYNRSNCTSSLIWITTQEDSSKTCLSTLGWMVDSNPLTLISDKHITSPYNIHTLSSKQVMRILKFIRQKLI